MLSWGFAPFSVFRVPEARFSRVYLARHLPPSGFHTLMTVCFLRNPPAMFQTGTLLGFSLQGISPLQSLRILSDSIPFMMLALRTRTACAARALSAPSSRLYSLQGFATASAGVSHRKTAAALMVFCLLGVSFQSPPAAHATDPLMGFTPATSSRTEAPEPWRKCPSRVLTSTGSACLFRDCRPF